MKRIAGILTGDIATNPDVWAVCMLLILAAFIAFPFAAALLLPSLLAWTMFGVLIFALLVDHMTDSPEKLDLAITAQFP